MKNRRVATIILNRNLPKVTDKLYNQLKKYNNDISDFYILESGSDKKNLSKNFTWWANDKNTKKNGCDTNAIWNCSTTLILTVIGIYAFKNKISNAILGKNEINNSNNRVQE